nr:NBS-LRR disease resistance protein [Dasypyrum villosum]
MAELVATMLVGPLLSTVKEKASSYLLDQYKVMEAMEEQHRILKCKLQAILDVIADAEHAATQREGAKAWLEEVKRMAYEANEIFDEFKYEALRREAKKNGHYNKLGFNLVKLFPTLNRFAFRDKMGKKLCRILQAIEVLVAEMNAFGFKCQQQAPTPMHSQQMDPVVFDPKKIISRSRSQDTKNIVHTLLCKTTLAQLIYDEPEVQKHFELLIWVCVSDSFDVNSLARRIVDFHLKNSIIKAPFKKGPLDSLQIVLSGRRYLLVLDDVRNRESDKWKKLEVRLAHGAKGSVVLATTRDEGVADIMGTVKAYNLPALEDNFMEEIIESKAFCLKKEEERPVMLVNMVGKIAKRCRGSPLAAAALGSMLRTKTSKEEWKAISRRSNICTEESGILPILKLSYNDMSSQMKQCFSFCAVFPKDYEIDVDKLIQLWIAHGFILDQNEVSPETIGKWIFNELTSRSFFVDVKQVRISIYEYARPVVGDYPRHTCKIQDLMHDVALSTMEKECALAPNKDPCQIEWLPDTARHLFLSCGQPETILNESVAKRSVAIQTLMCDCYIQMGVRLQHLSKYNSLKALRLLLNWVGPIPLKPKHLHHLRYLDLSRSYIESLPEDISILYSLQTLNISCCYSLRWLPRQMKYLTALRHLYTHCCPKLRSMPGGLGKLMSLQTLTCFIAGPTGSKCSVIGELQHLNLGGQLELNQLENVTEEDAKAANIGNKKELRGLTLKWSVGCTDDARVLKGLKPHDGLLGVRIESYGGTTFPTWMAMSRNMVEIQLFRCEKLQWLFGCDTPFTFPNLKELTLQDLHCFGQMLSIVSCAKLTALPDATLLGEPHGTMARSAFPALKELYLDCLDNFWKWEATEGPQRGHMVFPKLEKLTIMNCSILTALPEAPVDGDYSMARSAFPALKVLKLKCLSRFESWHAVEGSKREKLMFPQLEQLVVIHCENMTTLCGQRTFPSLQEIRIEFCPKLRTKAKSPKLSVLHMEGNEEEMFLWVARHMMSLTNLKLKNLEETESTLEAADHSLTQVVDAIEKWNRDDFPMEIMHLSRFKCGVTELCACFVRLQWLYINDCAALVHWPEKEFQGLVSLRSLEISYCKQLVGYAQAPAAEPSATLESSIQLLPSLEFLKIFQCKSMVEVFQLPASLRKLEILDCSKLKSIFSRRMQQEQAASSNLQGRSPVYSELSSSSALSRAEHSLFPCLESIYLRGCHSLPGNLDLPSSLKGIEITVC